MLIIQGMGTAIFWSAWLAGVVYFKTTTRAQRQRWAGVLVFLLTAALIAGQAASLATQGYLTHA